MRRLTQMCTCIFYLHLSYLRKLSTLTAFPLSSHQHIIKWLPTPFYTHETVRIHLTPSPRLDTSDCRWRHGSFLSSPKPTHLCSFQGIGSSASVCPCLPVAISSGLSGFLWQAPQQKADPRDQQDWRWRRGSPEDQRPSWVQVRVRVICHSWYRDLFPGRSFGRESLCHSCPEASGMKHEGPDPAHRVPSQR